MKRKILSILLAALMLCSLLPVTALADADPTAGTDTENYVTLELRFGESVSEIDQAAAKAVYEGKKYESASAANEAYMALFGVNWTEKQGATGNGKPGYYLNVTDQQARLRRTEMCPVP